MNKRDDEYSLGDLGMMLRLRTDNEILYDIHSELSEINQHLQDIQQTQNAMLQVAIKNNKPAPLSKFRFFVIWITFIFSILAIGTALSH